MGVFKRKERGGVWTYRFRRDGERFKGVCVMPDGTKAKTRDEALRCEARVREQVARDKTLTSPPKLKLSKAFREGLSLAQAFALHFQNVPEAGDNHKRGLRRAAQEAFSFFGSDIDVTAITQDMADAYKAEVIKRPRRIFVGGQHKLKDADLSDESLWKVLGRRRAPQSINHVLNTFRSALSAVHNIRDPQTGASLLPHPPKIKRVKVPERTPMPMPQTELEARLESAAPWIKDATLLARAYGLQRAEVLNVELGHIYEPEKCLRLPPDLNKSKDFQLVHTTPEGWELTLNLRRQARFRGVKHLITWPGNTDWNRMRHGKAPKGALTWRPLKSIRRGWEGTAARAEGLEAPHRFHDLRAAYITEVARVAPTALVKKLARHKSFHTTERYIGLEDQDAKDAMQAVQARRARLRAIPGGKGRR